MPGGGKSTVGRHLARRLGWGFVDSDTLDSSSESENRFAAISNARGEDRFRDLEQLVIQELTSQTGSRVIATGGGVCLREGELTRIAQPLYGGLPPVHARRTASQASARHPQTAAPGG